MSEEVDPGLLLTREEARHIKIAVVRGKNLAISLASRSILTCEVGSTIVGLVMRGDDRDLADSRFRLSTIMSTTLVEGNRKGRTSVKLSKLCRKCTTSLLDPAGVE